MPIHIGLSTKNQQQISFNGKNMQKVYVGAKLVWQKMIAVLGGYGLLYNWFATQQKMIVENGCLYNYYAIANLKEIGNVNWRPQTRIESYDLSVSLGSNNAGKLKEIGNTHWKSGNIGATNELKLNIIPSCRRSIDGNYMPNVYNVCYAWLADEIDADYAYGQQTAQSDNTYFGWQVQMLKKEGCPIRLRKDSTLLSDGQSGIYIGNDGKIYATICIYGVEYLANNLAETKYRDGSLIPNVTDNTTWLNLTTGARCSYNNDETNAFTTAGIAPAGWHVQTVADTNTLISYLGGDVGAGGKLKETGSLHWDNPNVGATNEVGFNAVGSGVRIGDTGIFAMFKVQNFLLIANDWNGFIVISSATADTGGAMQENQGCSIRLIKDDSTDPGTLTDIDGNIYPTVKIGTQVWTALNWKCTKLNDGTPIPNVTGNAAWAALTTGAYCCYDNDPLNI